MRVRGVKIVELVKSIATVITVESNLKYWDFVIGTKHRLYPLGRSVGQGGRTDGVP